jgi:hypothetical protein
VRTSRKKHTVREAGPSIATSPALPFEVTFEEISLTSQMERSPCTRKSKYRPTHPDSEGGKKSNSKKAVRERALIDSGQ